MTSNPDPAQMQAALTLIWEQAWKLRNDYWFSHEDSLEFIAVCAATGLEGGELPDSMSWHNNEHPAPKPGRIADLEARLAAVEADVRTALSGMKKISPTPVPNQDHLLDEYYEKRRTGAYLK